MSQISNRELADWWWMKISEYTNECCNCDNPKWRVFYDEWTKTETSVDWEDDYYICRRCLLKEYIKYLYR